MKKVAVIHIVLLVVLLSAVPAIAEDEKSDEPRWDSFTFAPKLGYIYLGDVGGDLGTPRHGMQLMVDFDFGGTGAGFDLAFVYDYEDVVDHGTWHSLGVYTGFSYRMHFDDFYPYIGIGSHFGYLLADDLDGGMDMILRIPFGLTYYVLEDLGVLLELGVGYGTTVANGKGTFLSDDWDWSHGVCVDVMAGIRVP